MIAVWRRVVARRLLEERVRTSLTLLGVALGVGVFVAMRLASVSAFASFSDTVDAVAGRATLQVSAGSEGIDERVYPRIRRTDGVEAASPVIETWVRARPGGPATRPDRPADDWPETLMLLGLDLMAEPPFARWPAPASVDREASLALLADPRAVSITRALAARHGLSEGDTLSVLVSGRPEPLVVRRVLDAPELNHALGGNVAILDIAAAQELLGRPGRIDRVDLIVAPEARERVRPAIAALLPADATIAPPQGRTRQVEHMVRAFDLNLFALSFVALFVAMFLIFNAVALSVLRWRREIGILRSCGVTRRGIAAMFIGEGLLFGVLGSAVGIALGTWLAKGSLGMVSRTLTDLYLVRHAATLHADPSVYAAGFALGVGASLLSAALPAWEAARTPPGVTMRQGVFIEARSLPVARWALAGLALLIAAAGVALWTVGAGRPAGGFLSAFLTLAGFSACAPAAMLAVTRVLAVPVRRLAGVAGTLGARFLTASIARTGAAVASLMVAAGMLVALTIMVGSFRSTVDTWVTQTIRGDLYVEPVGLREGFGSTALPDTLVDRTRMLPGVLAVDTFRGSQFTHDGRLAFAAGVDLDVQRRLGSLQFAGGSAPAILTSAIAGDGVLASESFAHHHRVRAGDTLSIATPSGTARLRVAGVYYDYSTDAGSLLMHAPLYERLWRVHRVQRMAVYATPGTDVTELRCRLLIAAGPVVLSATPHQALRARVLDVFDQTFQITWALQAIAVLVAVLGVAGTLTALILQRGREIAMLRAIGSLRRQVRRMVLVESALIGITGATLGSACGLALAMLLVHVINRQYFGWTIRMDLGPGVFLQTMALLVAASVLAGLGPARAAATRVAAEAMRME